MSEFPDTSRIPAPDGSPTADWASRHSTEQEATSPAAAPARSVTFRILFIGTVLIFINCYWVIEVEGIWHSNHATAMSLFWNSIFFLLLLVLLNVFVLKPLARLRQSGQRAPRAVRMASRLLPRNPFSQGELITIYVMMTIAS